MDEKKLIFWLIFGLLIPIQSFAAYCGAEVRCSCGDTVSSPYVLEEDLKCSGNGLDLIADIDCKNYKIKGSGNGFGLQVKGVNFVDIRNCNIQNFENGIEIKDNSISNRIYKPIQTTVSNSNLENNQIGLSSQGSVSDFIFNNTFRNNSKFSVSVSSEDMKIFSNVFYNDVLFYSSASTNNFCFNGEGNTYIDGAQGPTCNCHIPFENMIIDSSIKLCKGEYNLDSGIEFRNNANLDCDGSFIIGNGEGVGINVNGASFTGIENCNIMNYTTGVSYTIRKEGNGYATSHTNQILDSNITNVDIGVSAGHYSFQNQDITAERIHGNTIIADMLNIDSSIVGSINATDNFWGTNNVTQIESKFNQVEKIFYNPFRNISLENDFRIVDLDYDYSNIKVEIDSDKFWLIDQLEVEILDIYEGIIVANKTIPINPKRSRIILNEKWDIHEGHQIQVILDPRNLVLDEDRTNNYMIKTIDVVDLYFLEIDTGLDILDEELEIFFSQILDGSRTYEEDYGYKLEVKNSNQNSYGLFPIDIGYAFNLPYEGLIENDNNSITIFGEDVSGILAAVKRFEKNNFFYLDNRITSKIYKDDEDAISIFDYLRQSEDYKKNSEEFRVYIRDVLYDTREEIEEQFLFVDSIKYRLREYKPRNSQTYISHFNENNYPVLMAGGLWSDVLTWEELAKQLSVKGYNVFLLELTGGEGSDCTSCINYNYSFLTNRVLPTYVDFVLNKTNASKFNYVGHSNGARVSLDSLSKGEVNPELINTLVSVGSPGKFEELTKFTQIVNDSGTVAIERIERKNISHVTIARVGHELESSLGEIAYIFKSFGKQNSISLNLFKQYNDWISFSDDENPGIDLIVNKFLLIYSDYRNKSHDQLVPVVDSLNIFNGVVSDNKEIFVSKARHTSMTSNREIFGKILEALR